MALTNDGCAIRMHGDPDPGEVDRQEGPAVLAGEDTAGFDRLPVPTIEPKDPVGFRDRIPAFDVGQLAAKGLTRPDMAVIEVAPQVTPAQCRAARGLLDWSQQDLAGQAGVGIVTVRQVEAGATEPRRATLVVVRQAFERAGLY